MSDNANVGKVFNVTGGSGGGGSLKLESLAVTTPPDKTVYKSGERFDPTGMAVTAGYGYGINTAVTGYTVSPTVLTDGVTEVTVTYTEGRVTKTTTTPVTVKKVLVSIAVTTPPSKTAYRYLEKFDPAGMVVTATFSDGSTAAVTGYTYPTTAFSTLGSQNVNLGYTYEGVTKNVNLSVTVSAVTVEVPTQTGTLTYDGGSKSPSWSGYDSVKMTLGGTTSGVGAGTYVAKFTLAYGYLFPNGTSEATANWAIGRAVIAALPVQNNILAADGTRKTPTWDGYDVSKLTIGGDQFGTNAGEYTATFTPTSNYQWWDGSTGPKNAVWTITSVIVSIPSQSGTLTYTGAAQTPQWANFDSGNSSVRVTPAADAGEYSAAFTLLSGMWSDGTTGEKTVKWTIGRAPIAAVPEQSGTLKYDGNPKMPVWDASYDSNKMTLSVQAVINAGTAYTASFTPTSNYKWWDGTVGAKTATWAIGKGDNVLTVSPAALELNTTAKSGTITVTRRGSGTISAVSSNTQVATIGAINQTTGEITVNGVNNNNGSAVITVRMAEDSNYLAPANKTVNVTAQFFAIYGVEWDWTRYKSTKGKRTDGAVGFAEPSPAVNNGSGSSPFDNLYPWNGMVKETRAGGVMVKEPKYWFKWTKTGTKLKLQVADGPVEGFHVDPVNMDRGDGLGELDFSYIGRYHCASDNWKSETNRTPKVNVTRSAAREGIHGLGANIWQFDFAQMWYIGMLFLVEFADWDGPTRIGNTEPIGSGRANNGTTDAMQYHTGTTTASRNDSGYIQYRNIEGYWDEVNDWMDGCYYNSNGLNVIKNPNQFSDSANGVLVGKPKNGRPTDMAIPTQSGLEWALYPSAIDSGITPLIPDTWMFDSTRPVLYHGGAFWEDYGPFKVHCYNGEDKGDYNITCRLQERPPKTV